jgi:hypothetical protein
VGDRHEAILERVCHLLALDGVEQRAAEPHVADDGRVRVDELRLDLDPACERNERRPIAPLLAQMTRKVKRGRVRA